MTTIIIILGVFLFCSITIACTYYRRKNELEQIMFNQQRMLHEKDTLIRELKEDSKEMELYRLEGELAHLCLMFGKEIHDKIKEGSMAGKETTFKNCILFDGPRQFRHEKSRYTHTPLPIVGVFYEPENDVDRYHREKKKAVEDMRYASVPLRLGLQGIIGTDIYMLGDETDYIRQFGDLKEIVAAVKETLQ